jgi:hypothetical protein
MLREFLLAAKIARLAGCDRPISADCAKVRWRKFYFPAK